MPQTHDSSLTGSRTIFLRMMGGLGNQIFVYAFAKWLRHYSGVHPVLFESGSDRVAGSSTRAIQVNQLFPNVRIMPSTPGKVIFCLALSRKYQSLFGRLALKHFEPSSMAECIASTTELKSSIWPVFTGFFQFEALVRAEIDELREESNFELKRRLSALQNNNGLGELDLKRDCVIHLRRGQDYRIAGFKLLGSSYYRNACLALNRQGFDGRLFFVSDDLNAGAQILEGAGLSAEPLTLEDPLDVLSVIAHARHKIIANSTFSFWGALFGQLDTTVLFPSEWPLDSKEFTKIGHCFGWTECAT